MHSVYGEHILQLEKQTLSLHDTMIELLSSQKYQTVVGGKTGQHEFLLIFPKSLNDFI